MICVVCSDVHHLQIRTHACFGWHTPSKLYRAYARIFVLIWCNICACVYPSLGAHGWNCNQVPWEAHVSTTCRCSLFAQNFIGSLKNYRSMLSVQWWSFLLVHSIFSVSECACACDFASARVSTRIDKLAQCMTWKNCSKTSVPYSIDKVLAPLHHLQYSLLSSPLAWVAVITINTNTATTVSRQNA